MLLSNSCTTCCPHIRSLLIALVSKPVAGFVYLQDDLFSVASHDGISLTSYWQCSDPQCASPTMRVMASFPSPVSGRCVPHTQSMAANQETSQSAQFSTLQAA
eukprot:1188786-Prorocentrum_minimum.AAC.2